MIADAAGHAARRNVWQNEARATTLNAVEEAVFEGVTADEALSSH